MCLVHQSVAQLLIFLYGGDPEAVLFEMAQSVPSFHRGKRPESVLSLAGGTIETLDVAVPFTHYHGRTFSATTALRAQNTLSATPSVVFLNATVGGGAVQQPVTVTSAPSALIPVAATTTVPWLTFATSSPTTPSTITFIGNPAGMAAGVYNAVVNLTSASATTLQVVAVMTVNAASPLSSNPTNLTFNYSQGSAIPGAQSLALTSVSPTGYTVTGSANWLLFGGSNGTTPGTVTVGINPGGLSTGAQRRLRYRHAVQRFAVRCWCRSSCLSPPARN